MFKLVQITVIDRPTKLNELTLVLFTCISQSMPKLSLTEKCCKEESATSQTRKIFQHRTIHEKTFTLSFVIPVTTQKKYKNTGDPAPDAIAYYL